MFLRWNGYRNMEGYIMEVIGLLILLIIGSTVVYFLDLQKIIWNAFKGFFETSKKRYVEIKQDQHDRAAEKRTRALKKAADARKRTKEIFKQWRIEEDARREAKKIEESYKPSSISEDYFFEDHITVHNNGSISADPKKFLRHPNVQRQIKGMQQLFKHETLRALYKGEEPPQSIGEGCWTKERLKKEWNDEWQADLKIMRIVPTPKHILPIR